MASLRGWSSTSPSHRAAGRETGQGTVGRGGDAFITPVEEVTDSGRFKMLTERPILLSNGIT